MHVDILDENQRPERSVFWGPHIKVNTESKLLMTKWLLVISLLVVISKDLLISRENIAEKIIIESFITFD